jgi:hypothetical protein
LGIKERLAPVFPSFLNFLDSAEGLNLSNKQIITGKSIYYSSETIKRYNSVLIELDGANCLLNGQPVSKEKLFSICYDLFKKYESRMTIIFEIDEKITYGRYIEYKDIILSSIGKLRNELSLHKYGKPFKEWYGYGHKYDSIRAIYPWLLLEWTPEEKRLQALIKKAGKKQSVH